MTSLENGNFTDLMRLDLKTMSVFLLLSTTLPNEVATRFISSRGEFVGDETRVG